MNRKLTRLFRPGMGGYFLVMGAFCVAALVEEHYWLAAVETAVTLLVFILSRGRGRFRRCWCGWETAESSGRITDSVS